MRQESKIKTRYAAESQSNKSEQRTAELMLSV